ncbi:hypothetical protein WJX84_005626, partial [Apatococcus fuscideae]
RTRELSVKRKLNAMPAVFSGRNVLLVDDSIVRGTTMSQIVDMVRRAGAKKVYLASASPPVRFPNVYGVDLPTRREFVACDLSEDQIRGVLGADGLVYQSMADMEAVGQGLNPSVHRFEDSCFTGHYCTGHVDDSYLAELEASPRRGLRDTPTGTARHPQLEIGGRAERLHAELAKSRLEAELAEAGKEEKKCSISAPRGGV